jgi:hypothetical protein
MSKAFIGNLVSPGRGILLFFPLSILSSIGLRKLFHNDRWLAWVLTGFLFGTLLLYSAWKDWGGGISWGPRFLIPLLPYLTLLAFLGFDTLAKFPNLIRSTMLGILVILGGLIALQGTFYNFLGFYGIFNLPGQVVSQGDYNFLPQFSPLLAGWGIFTRPRNYDIYWIQKIDILIGNIWFLIGLSICLIAIVYLFRMWLVFFIGKPSKANQNTLNR